jgi:hypothetical protein
MNPAPCGKAEYVPNENNLWRRVMDQENHLLWSAEQGRWIPNLPALSFDPDLSTSWAEHLRGRHQEGPDILIKNNPKYTLVGEFRVGTLRDMDFGVRASPAGSVPPDCAHTSADWPLGAVPEGKLKPNKDTARRIRLKLASKVEWVHGEPSILPPDGG